MVSWLLRQAIAKTFGLDAGTKGSMTWHEELMRNLYMPHRANCELTRECRSHSAYADGRVMVTVVPWSGWLSMVMVPWLSWIRRAV